MFKNTLFLVLATLFIIACNKQAPLGDEWATDTTEQAADFSETSIQSVEDVQLLIDRAEYPFNQLSDEALRMMLESMTFTKEKELRSLNAELLVQELSEKEIQLLFERLTGDAVIMMDRIPTQEELEAISNARGKDTRPILYNHRPDLCLPCSPDCCTFQPNIICVLQPC